jgi:hypothetical protein
MITLALNTVLAYSFLLNLKTLNIRGRKGGLGRSRVFKIVFEAVRTFLEGVVYPICAF